MLVHLMLELYNCDRELLSNEPLIRRVLDENPARVDMEKVSPVHLYEIRSVRLSVTAFACSGTF